MQLRPTLRNIVLLSVASVVSIAALGSLIAARAGDMQSPAKPPAPTTKPAQVPSPAPTPNTKPTPTPATPATPAPAAAPTPPTPPVAAPKIAPLMFLFGTWRGSMNGGFVEEAWSAPFGNNMIGHFRWLKPDGTPGMFEVLAITQEGDDVRLRLRHFSPALAAKEPVDKPQTLILAESSATRALFKAEKDTVSLSQITYEVKDNTLFIVVEFAASDPPREPLKFELERFKDRMW